MIKLLRLPAHIHWWYFLVAIIPAMAGAGNFVVAKYVANDIPSFALNFWRWLTALIIFAPFSLRSAVREYKVIKSNFLVLSVISLLGVTIFNSVVYTASHYTTSINLGILVNIFPVIVMIIGHFFLKERANFIQVLSTILCLIGTFIIISRGDLYSLFELFSQSGDYLALIAALIWALYSISIRFKPKDLSFRSFIFSNILIGLFYLSPFFVWEQFTYPQDIIYTKDIIFAILYVGIFVSVIGLICYNFSILKLGANLTSVIFYLSPIFNVFLSKFFLGEEFTNYHLWGIILILMGINIISITKIFSQRH